MVSTATVVEKATGATREVSTSEPIVLDATSTITLEIDPAQVSTMTRAGVEGRDLVIVLDDGSQIVISNYFVADSTGALSELVLEDQAGALWWLRTDPETGGFLLVGDQTIPVASALSASDGAAVAAADPGGPSGLAIGLGLGALALGAAAAGGGGGSDGAPSPPVTPPPADTTPPATPTAQFDDTGTTVSGTAEAGSTVTVYGADGTPLGTAVTGADGNYAITLDPPLAAGEELTVTATDPAGNESDPVTLTAPDLSDGDAPATPTAVISAEGDVVSGTAEAGSTVTVYDAEGAAIGTAVTDADGNYAITLDPPLTAGEELTVTATDAAGNESDPIALTAPDLSDDVAPAAPTAVISAEGDEVSGTAEAGSTVTVYDADGTGIGTAVAGADGRYTITLDPPLTSGEALTVTATDAAGNESDPIALTAPDLSDDIAPDAPSAAISASGDAVSGSTEAGATVNVYGPDGDLIGTDVAGTDGRYTIALDPPLVDGEIVTVTATDALGNISDPTSATAPDLSDVDVPASPVAAINAAGDTVSGTAEAGSTVTVYDADGTALGSDVADAGGAYAITLDPPLVAGEQLSVTAANASGESFPTTIFAPDQSDTEAPDAPSAVINDAGDTVTGSAEPGSTVTVLDADGNPLGSGSADTDGRYTITLDPPLTGGEQLAVIATDAAGNISDPTTLTAPDLPDTEAPVPPSAVINDAGDTVTGITEAGATVELRDADGGLLGSDVANAEGRYTIGLDPPLTAGETLTARATDDAGNTSDPTSLTAPDLTDTEAPLPPTAVINAAGDMVMGTTEIGATVEVRDADGVLVGTAVAGTDGRYTAMLDPALTAGEVLQVRAIDGVGNTSDPTAVTAPDLTDDEAPDAPTAAISATGDLVTGTAEVGATVNLYDADDTVIGTAVAGTNGRYTITLDPPLTDGENLTATATDAAGNESSPIPLVAPDLSDTDGPEAPTATISEDGDTVAGTAEAGTTVRVYDVNDVVLGSAVAAGDGSYTIGLDPALTGGEQLAVTATDSDDNESFPTTIFAPDLSDTESPAPPTAAISAEGDVVSGSAEAGTTVTVYDADGAALGSAVAATDGRYTIPLSPALTDGEQLTVTATDAAGNISDPTPLMAPELGDTEAPPAPTAVINPAGDAVTGSAESGATVNIRDADGVLVGTAVAGTDGRYTAMLDPPQTDGGQLGVTATDAAGNISDPTLITAPALDDVVPPPAPLAAISADGATVSGTAEAGATVRVFDADDAVLGTAVAAGDGTYTIALTPPLIAGEPLTVTATDDAGNQSEPTALVAPVIPDTEAPLPPDATISGDGVTVSGTAEGESTVRVYNAAGAVIGTMVTGADGVFAITLDPPLTDGETLTVTATDAAGNPSEATPLDAPDLTAPDAPTAVISPDGATVSGIADEGATVTLYDEDRGELATTVAGPDGNYSFTLDPPLTGGERLLVTATDDAGNESDPTTINAPNPAEDVIAYDDIATVDLDLVPETAVVDHGSASYLALVSLNILNLQATVLGTETVEFSVDPGHSLDATFDYNALLTLGVLGNYQVVVQRFDGTQWTGVGGTGAATLLELNLLSGTASAEAELGPGEYRAFMTFNGVGVGVLGALAVGGVESDFTSIASVVSEPIEGNVTTDDGGDVVTATTIVQSVDGQDVGATATEIQGDYGVLTIAQDGTYTYEPTDAVASIGQVDQFTYTLFDPDSLGTDTATLYVRIDSNDVALTWDDANPGAPATFDFDVSGDSGSASVEFANVTGDLYDVSVDRALGLLSPATYNSGAFDVTGDMALSGTATVSLLVAVAASGSLSLQRETPSGGWTNVETVNYNILVGVAGPVATIDLSTLDDIGPGTYRFRATASSVVSANINVAIDVDATYADQFEVAGVANAAGNLLANDIQGSEFTQLEIFDTGLDTYVPVPGGDPLSVQGEFGVLTVDADGNYTYTPDDDVALFNTAVSDVFDYRLVHPSGATEAAELLVTVEPSGAGVDVAIETLDLDALAFDEVGADGEAANEANDDYDVAGLFAAQGSEALMVRGEGDTVLALDAAPTPGSVSGADFLVDYGVPLRQEDDTDVLLAHSTTSAL